MPRPPAVCGTEAGHRRHHDLGQPACTRCCDAYNVAQANRRHRREARRRPVNPIQYRQALAGREPSEALCGADRELLLRTLVEWGWTDVRIAEHTRQTTYTTARIRDRLGLTANHPTARSHVA